MSRELRNALRAADYDLGRGYEAAVALQGHLPVCPLARPIHVQVNSGFWHNDEDCDDLYDSGMPIVEFQACPRCARQNLQVVDEGFPENFPHGAAGTD